MQAFALGAPAKLNLCLHVTGRRPDGYHLIESLIVFTEHADRLEFSPAEGLCLDITGPFAGHLQQDTQNNLVLRAARLLAPHAPGKGARIVLHKQVPVGAGLGGGSGDAAAALKGLMRLWGITLDKQTVMELALALGSDVPVCYQGSPAWVDGIGEQVRPCRIQAELWAVLAHPGVPLLTAEVYKRFEEPFAAPAKGADGFENSESLLADMRARRNMLQPAAICLQPVIGEMLSRLEKMPACLLARMSGSGSACFGLYAAQAEAHAAAAQMRQEFPGGWTVATRLR